MSSPPRPNVGRQGAPGVADSLSSVVHPSRAIARRWLFALLTVTCVAVAVGYVTWTVVRDRASGRSAVSGPVATSAAGANIALVPGGTGTVLFQNAVPGEYWARVGLVPLGGPESPRSMLPLGCLRIHFAAERGLCLAEDGGGFATDGELFSTHAAYIFGPDFQVRHQLALSGIPSRARVSPDGRYGAITVFVSGHSYAEGGFSTETTLIDLVRGDKIVTLEEFAVTRDGKRFESIDFNFWGVTFASDSNRFYATLGTGGQTYLVEGDVGARQLRVLRENLECPSLSPDNTRIAFKKRVGDELGSVQWQFHVLDLATMTETPLAESRSIDDQIEWLDDERLLYGDGTDLWVVSANGTGQPRRFMSKAASPAVVRTASLPPPGVADAAVDTLTLPSTDLALAVSVPPNPARVGENITYTVTVTNRGPVDATDLVVEQSLPKGVSFGSASTLQLASGGWGCSHPDESHVMCDTSVLRSGESWTLGFTVRPTAVGTVGTQVSIYAMEPDLRPEDNSTTTEITAAAGP